MVKNLPANAEDVRDMGSIPGSGRSPGGGNGNPLQYSCLKNFMDFFYFITLYFFFLLFLLLSTPLFQPSSLFLLV